MSVLTITSFPPAPKTPEVSRPAYSRSLRSLPLAVEHRPDRTLQLVRKCTFHPTPTSTSTSLELSSKALFLQISVERGQKLSQRWYYDELLLAALNGPATDSSNQVQGHHGIHTPSPRPDYKTYVSKYGPRSAHFPTTVAARKALIQYKQHKAPTEPTRHRQDDGDKIVSLQVSRAHFARQQLETLV